MDGDDREIQYYRTVEDFFSGLRGVPHVLSPKDFQLLRQWWRDGVPLSAVLAGITEVFEKKRARGDEDPVTSLSYCRHAVHRHAKAVAAARVGATLPGPVPDAGLVAGRLRKLASEFRTLAAGQEEGRPAVARVLSEAAGTLEASAGEDMEADRVEELLMALETRIMEGLHRALPGEELAALEEEARAAADASGATGEARERTRRAALDRRIRTLLGLPRMELE